jgi:ATP-dependent Clp protease ATP-binding subunit ClpA
LFDEIEKGSQPLWDLLLHIMDDGEISLLDRAEKVSFKNSIIIMTSNLGSHEMMGLLQPQKLGFRTTQTDEAPVSNQEINTVVNKALYLRFSPEFINRFDRKVVFKPLDDGQLSQVLDRYVEKANYDRYLGHGVKLSLSPTLRDEMVTGNTQRRQLGVRPILRDYDHMIESKLATLMNTESIPLGSDVVAMSSTELQHVEEARKGDVNFYYKNNPELVEYLEKLALEREQKAARLANEQEIFQAAEESEETLPPNND